MGEQKIHHGNAIRIFREFRNMKQAYLAKILGFEQSAISKIEKKAIVKPYYIDKIAEALQIPSYAIRNFDETVVLDILLDALKNKYV